LLYVYVVDLLPFTLLLLVVTFGCLTFVTFCLIYCWLFDLRLLPVALRCAFTPLRLFTFTVYVGYVDLPCRCCVTFVDLLLPRCRCCYVIYVVGYVVRCLL